MPLDVLIDPAVDEMERGTVVWDTPSEREYMVLGGVLVIPRDTP